jgi:hypothetical protein
MIYSYLDTTAIFNIHLSNTRGYFTIYLTMPDPIVDPDTGKVSYNTTPSTNNSKGP